VSLEWSYKRDRRDDSSNFSRASSLEQWLHANGAAVRHLDVQGSYGDTLDLQLPVAKLLRLQHMRIHYCTLQLQASSAGGRQQEGQLVPAAVSASCSSQLSLSSLSRLTTLDLLAVKGNLAGLPALMKLRSLKLEGIHAEVAETLQPPQQQQQAEQQQEQQQEQGQPQQVESEQQLAKRAVQQNVCDAVASFVQLTLLQLSADLLPTHAAGPFSCLQKLRELDLGYQPVMLSNTLKGLPPSLTKLSMCWGGQEQLLSRASVPVLAALTALQELQLSACYIHGVRQDFLQSMKQLQVLKLEVRLSHDALQLLCDVLPALRRLRSLTLSVEEGEAEVFPASELARYSALLPVSRHLQELEISWETGSAPRLAAGCAEHMFPLRHKKRQLHYLVLGLRFEEHVAAIDASEHDEIAEGIRGMPACFGLGDVSRLVACCPALQTLWIPGLVAQGVDLSGLLSMEQLYCVFVGGEVRDDDVASNILAHMTQLGRLKVYAAPQLTDQGLLAFTALRGLTMLESWRCGFSSSVSTEDQD
jgi:hypothetical protein